MPVAVIDFQRFNADRNSQKSAYDQAYANEAVTIKGRHYTDDVALALPQLKAEKADVEAHPPEYKIVFTTHGGERGYWTYDPNYLLRLNGAISAKENEIATRYQITRKLTVQ